MQVTTTKNQFQKMFIFIVIHSKLAKNKNAKNCLCIKIQLYGTLTCVDLMSMMIECSDLSAPNKARTFHKPSLKELPATHHHHHQTFQQSRHAHQWKPEEDLTNLFMVEGQS